eukprot:COSAG03_NODE_14150_length_475_cov_0.688830_1_plen_31_part_10
MRDAIEKLGVPEISGGKVCLSSFLPPLFPPS